MSSDNNKFSLPAPAMGHWTSGRDNENSYRTPSFSADKEKDSWRKKADNDGGSCDDYDEHCIAPPMGHFSSGRDSNGNAGNMYRPSTFRMHVPNQEQGWYNSGRGRGGGRGRGRGRGKSGGDAWTENMGSSSRTDIHVGVNCDHCGQRPLVGIRYKCLFCSNYDLCSPCLEDLEKISSSSLSDRCFHDPSHRFVRLAQAIPVRELPPFLQNRSAMIHHGTSCHACKQRDITGFRYFCTQCGTSFCEACELHGEHSIHTLMKMHPTS